MTIEKSIHSLEGRLLIALLALCVILVFAVLYYSGDDGLTDEMKAALFNKAMETLTPDNLEQQLPAIKEMFKKPPFMTWEKAVSIGTTIATYAGLQGYFTSQRTKLKSKLPA